MRGILQEVGESFLHAPLGGLDMWDKPLRQLAELTGSAQTQLIGQSIRNRGEESILFHYITDIHPNAAEDYFSVGADRPEVNWKVAMRSAPLKIMHEPHYRQVEESRHHKDVFTEYLKDYRAYNGAHMTMIDEDDAQFTIALLRDNIITAEQLETFNAISPYVHAATLMQRAMEAKGFSIANETIDMIGIPVFLLDRQCHVHTMTKSAEALVRSEAPLDIRSRYLHALPSANDKLLQSAIISAQAGRHHQRVILPNKLFPANSLIIEIFALPRREWSFGFEPRILVTVRQPRETGHENKQMLAEIFQLTETESDIALHMMNGLDREEIAARRSSSLATVTSHLKSIFRKTDVRREGTLIALLNRILRP